MHRTPIKTSLLLLLVGLGLFSAACHQSSEPPPPLAIEELPGVFDKAFSKAKADTQAAASEIIASVLAKDYAKAYAGLQALLGQSSLTPDQRRATARGLLAVNSALHAAQASGDPAAAETLRQIRQNR
ncbi:MAG: hypothetical protein ACLQU3_03535 [Limisphaerales bacterium]